MSDTIEFFGEELEVKTDVPMPPRRRHNTETDDLAKLPVNGYVLFPCDDKGATQLRNRVAAVGKRFGMRFSTRRLDSGVGIWRTE